MNKINHAMWAERYRPQTLEDCVLEIFPQDQQRWLASSPNKIFVQFHPDFFKEYRAFQKSWARFTDCYSGWKLRDFKSITFEEFERLYEEASALPAAINNTEEDDWEFDSEHDSAAELVKQLVEDARDGGDLDESVTKMAEAFGWFENRGLDLNRFERRWRMTPWIALPQHVSDRPIVVGKTEGLYWLLEEAVRTYCFGNDGSTIALCRSITEELIEEKYLVVKQDGKLVQNIREAENRYPQLKTHNLSERVRIANEVLHEGRLEVSKFKRWKDSENFIREWLSSLKSLIEAAPQQKR